MFFMEYHVDAGRHGVPAAQATQTCKRLKTFQSKKITPAIIGAR